MKVVETRTAGWPQLVLLLVAGSIPVLGAVLIAPVLPLIAQQYAGVPGVEVLVPIVLTVPALVIGLTAPFAGQIVDRLGRLRVLRLGRRPLLPVEFAVAGVGPVIVFAASSPVVVMIGAVITGFTSGLLFPTLITWVMDAVEFDQRGRGIGLWTGAAYVGQFVSPLVIFALAVPMGWLQGGIGALGVIALLAGAVLWGVLRGRAASTPVPAAQPADG